jgi:hypothetical protein
MEGSSVMRPSARRSSRILSFLREHPAMARMTIKRLIISRYRMGVPPLLKR